MKEGAIPANGLQRPVLEGVRIIELAAIGPAPFCGMMLADHGAEVIRIDRPGGSDPLAQDQRRDVLLRNRKSITLDLKDPASVEIVLRLAETADGLIEGFRPGVTERLGLGPEALMQRNPALIYGRMTGWGQTGEYAQRAGHDINYLSLNGCLSLLGKVGEPPQPPLNLIADYGGGGMMLAFGMVSALLAAKSTGRGRVIDCNMSEGSATLMAAMWSLRHNGMWGADRGRNLLDGGAPFYGCYETKDGKYIAIGAVEAQFYARLLDRLGLANHPLFADQLHQPSWPAMKDKLVEIFLTKSRQQWGEIFEDTDCCFTEVLTMEEAQQHPHNRSRNLLWQVDQYVQPKSSPQYGDTDKVPSMMWSENSHRSQIMKELSL